MQKRKKKLKTNGNCFCSEKKGKLCFALRERIDTSIRYSRQPHNILGSLSEWKQPGQENNECARVFFF